MTPTRRLPVAAVAVCLVLIGCSGQAGTTPATSPIAQATVSAALTPIATAAPTPTPTPVATPAPTLFSETEDAAEAPPGAISVLFTGDALPRFAPDQINATSGTAVFFLDNSKNPDLSSAHNMQIGLSIGHSLASSTNVTAGDSETFTVHDLEPGTYAFWCAIQNHFAIGMVGTLTVTP